jgi:hypothetical protein
MLAVEIVPTGDAVVTAKPEQCLEVALVVLAR